MTTAGTDDICTLHVAAHNMDTDSGDTKIWEYLAEKQVVVVERGAAMTDIWGMSLLSLASQEGQFE